MEYTRASSASVTYVCMRMHASKMNNEKRFSSQLRGITPHPTDIDTLTPPLEECNVLLEKLHDFDHLRADSIVKDCIQTVSTGILYKKML